MFRDGGKVAAIRKSVEGKQEKAKKLLEKLKWLYDSVGINQAKRDAINLLHVQYTRKQRETMEEFTQKEIDIIEDKGNHYLAGIVGPDGKEINN